MLDTAHIIFAPAQYNEFLCRIDLPQNAILNLQFIAAVPNRTRFRSVIAGYGGPREDGTYGVHYYYRESFLIQAKGIDSFRFIGLNFEDSVMFLALMPSLFVVNGNSSLIVIINCNVSLIKEGKYKFFYGSTIQINLNATLLVKSSFFQNALRLFYISGAEGFTVDVIVTESIFQFVNEFMRSQKKKYISCE
jgi:hypothetical protein